MTSAQRGDLSVFEYLLEHGAAMPSNADESVNAMIQRRRDWIDQALAIAHRWHVPLIAVRVIHEYVVGFNWLTICEDISIKSMNASTK